MESETRNTHYRRSLRKRHFPVSLTDRDPERRNEETDFEYDGFKNIIYRVVGELKKIRKDIKPMKASGGKKGKGAGYDMKPVQEKVGNLNPIWRSLNAKLKIELEEDSSLRQENEGLKRKLDAANDEFKKIDQELRIATTESKIKSRELDKATKELKEKIEELKEKNEELKYLKEQSTKTESDRKKLEGECVELQKSLEETLATEREESLQKQNYLKEENKQILQQMETQMKQREDKIKRLQNDISSMENIIQQLQNERQTLEKEQQHKDEALTSTQNDLVNMESIIQQFQTERQTSEEERKHTAETLTSLQNDLFRKENLIQQLQKQRDHERQLKEEERQHKDEALTRLSAIAGDRLRNNNPGITDLSDPNRPMKIAEKFTEMYDNDWTDSMEALEDLGLVEEKCVEILLHFVTDSYEECGRIVEELNNNLKKTVMVTMCDGESDGETNQSEESEESSQDLPAEITKPILDLRRKLIDNNIEALTKKLPVHLKKKRNLTEEQMSACQNFIRDCIKYTWMMQIQDPPVHIEWAFPRESDIDSNLLRSYTKAGEKVDYIVWPVLYLHKGGAVLNKGVVQPFSHTHNGN